MLIIAFIVWGVLIFFVGWTLVAIFQVVREDVSDKIYSIKRQIFQRKHGHKEKELEELWSEHYNQPAHLKTGCKLTCDRSSHAMRSGYSYWKRITHGEKEIFNGSYNIDYAGYIDIRTIKKNKKRHEEEIARRMKAAEEERLRKEEEAARQRQKREEQRKMEEELQREWDARRRREQEAQRAREEAARRAEAQRRENARRYEENERRRREEERKRRAKEEAKKRVEEEFRKWQEEQERRQRAEQSRRSSGSYDFFKGCNTWEKVTARYKNLMKTYHPDSGVGDEDTAKVINAQYDEQKLKFGK